MAGGFDAARGEQWKTSCPRAASSSAIRRRWQRHHGVSAHIRHGAGSANTAASVSCHAGWPMRAA